MKVLMTADTVGGVWTYAVELARALTDCDCTIALVALGSLLREDQRADVENLPNVRTYELPGRLEWMDDPWDDVEASRQELRRIADDFAPDLIHANSYCHAAMAWEVPVLLVAHSCVVSWFAEVRGEEPGPEWNRYRRTVREAIDAADLVVGPTAAMLRFLEQGYGPVRSTKVIPNGIGVSRDEAFDEATYPASKERAVFAAGRMWDEAKNLVAVARAADRIQAPVRVASLPHPDGLNVQHDGVEYLGPLDRAGMDEQFCRAAVFAHPARYEPFGLTPLEAALHGCALVLGDIPTLREIWGDAALFVPPDDAEALAGAVNRLLDDEALRRTLVERAMRRARRLTADRMADSYFEQYARLCARQPQETR